MSDEVVVIQTFSNETDATMAQQMLQESGVRAFVLKDDAGGMEPHLQRTRGVRLVVKPDDAKRARKILETIVLDLNSIPHSMPDGYSLKTRLAFAILP